ncbi:MAG TPA: ABC transporter permease [Candidatus Limnocylindrales bacterium]|nr:ABC transporter permease [Candidatus Limnocylindrales bacterium]
MTAEPMAVAPGRPRRRPLAALRDVGTGIAAVMTKELRGRMRGRRAFVILTIHLLLLAGFTWMMEALQERTTGAGFGSAFFASAQIGRELFIAILMLQTLIVLVLAPASTAGSISLEREKQTLDLLATTPISSLAIVLGKLVSALTWVFLLILASIPITALVFTFGGVGPEDVVRGYLVLVLTAIGFGSIGLFFSALVKRTQAATVLNFVTMLGVTGGATFVFVFWSVMTGWQVQPGFARDESFLDSLRRRPPEALLYLNPFVAQADVICGTETGFGTYCGIIGAVTDRQLVALDRPIEPGIGIAEPQQFGVQRDSYWPRSMAAWVIVSLVLIVLSVQLVTPTRRWRLGLPRRRRRATGSPA